MPAMLPVCSRLAPLSVTRITSYFGLKSRSTDITSTSKRSGFVPWNTVKP